MKHTLLRSVLDIDLKTRYISVRPSQNADSLPTSHWPQHRLLVHCHPPPPLPRKRSASRTVDIIHVHIYIHIIHYTQFWNIGYLIHTHTYSVLKPTFVALLCWQKQSRVEFVTLSWRSDSAYNAPNSSTITGKHRMSELRVFIQHIANECLTFTHLHCWPTGGGVNSNRSSKSNNPYNQLGLLTGTLRPGSRDRTSNPPVARRPALPPAWLPQL